MKVVLCKKVSVDTISYGEEVSSEVIYLENVTNIALTTSDNVEYYSITHKTGDDASAHVSSYAVNGYVINIM